MISVGSKFLQKDYGGQIKITTTFYLLGPCFLASVSSFQFQLAYIVNKLKNKILILSSFRTFNKALQLENKSIGIDDPELDLNLVHQCLIFVEYG